MWKIKPDLSSSYDSEKFFPEHRLFEQIECIPDEAIGKILTQTIDTNFFIAENLKEWIVINEKKLLYFDPKKAIILLKQFWFNICIESTDSKMQDITVLLIIRLFQISFSTQKLYHYQKVKTQLTLREKVQEIRREGLDNVKNPYIIKAIKALSRAYTSEDLLWILA